ncbi:MAG: glycosyltransferase family 4 protein [Flavobacteriales bacterium]|nr:glycosyltransferase family 4 protein [Flavobacteriales bacterium]MBL4736403.1 glycosyltransferase family 4 protein [Flavobacteriales bacterium]
MKIAVNTRLLLKNRLEGIGWFTFETLRRITKNHPEHHFYFLFDRPHSEEFIFSNNITPVRIGLPARHPILFYLWFEFSVQRALSKLGADLFLSTDGYLSLDTTTRSIPVIHDINFEHHPEQLPIFTRRYYKYYFPKFARKAIRIATVSEYSKADIVSKYGINEDNIDVVYNGANEIYNPISEEEKESARVKYANGNPYFLFIGSLLPRKNISNLFRAFDLFKNSTDNQVKLMIVGEKKWWTAEIENTYNTMKFKNDVIFKGHTAPEELRFIIPAALAMTYVSFFEGFGIPIIEAMKCETPVITSDASCMPEIAGGAALLSDPNSPESIMENMKIVANNPGGNNELIIKGLKRASDFSWDVTAEKLWMSMEKVLGL